ncbi:hypothetical protein BDW42DRAFT_190599 [Aspergillus taichungensis]|uniref:Uncharacterized protein n=1 Tax=Aspergillus taichungensis TaxID=482145 RepID=A0A2J5I778_9EURO|nr:hypothetical protein BDW42DRAFT_190599 [Aspergillus taichungensis]
MQSPNPSPSNVRSPAEDPSSNTFFDVPLEESPSSPSPVNPDESNYDWIEAEHAEQPLQEEEGIFVDEAEIEDLEYVFNDDDNDDDSLPGYNSPIEDTPVSIVDMDAHAAELRDALVQDRLLEVQDTMEDNVWMFKKVLDWVTELPIDDRTEKQFSFYPALNTLNQPTRSSHPYQPGDRNYSIGVNGKLYTFNHSTSCTPQ